MNSLRARIRIRKLRVVFTDFRSINKDIAKLGYARLEQFH